MGSHGPGRRHWCYGSPRCRCDGLVHGPGAGLPETHRLPGAGRAGGRPGKYVDGASRPRAGQVASGPVGTVPGAAERCGRVSHPLRRGRTMRTLALSFSPNFSGRLSTSGLFRLRRPPTRWGGFSPRRCRRAGQQGPG